MARWLQQTVQGMLNPELKDLSIPVTDAEFLKSGDPRYYWTEHVKTHDTETRAHLVRHRRAAAHHTEPNQPPNRPYGVCTVLVPALSGRLTCNGSRGARASRGSASARAGPSAPRALAFSESWTEPR